MPSCARLSQAAGALTEAASLYDRAHDADQRIGPTLNLPAHVYVGQGEWVKAEPLLRRFVKLWEAKGPSEPLVIRLTNLAEVVRRQGRTAEADGLAAKAEVLQAAIRR